MKMTALISVAVSLGIASFSAYAAKPHPVSSYIDLNVSCSCDWSTDPSACTVSWSNVGAPAYGVSIDFEAEWVENGVSMSSGAELDLNDDWACDSVTGTCSAAGIFALPYYPADADISFDGKVKGFDNGPDGVTPRSFAKQTGACNLADSVQTDEAPIRDTAQF